MAFTLPFTRRGYWMIINTHARIGLFDRKLPFSKKGLFLYDFTARQETLLPLYAEWEAKDMSHDGRTVAITRMSDFKKAERTDLVVFKPGTGDVMLETHDYYIYDAAFNAAGDKILIYAHNKKPFCYDITSKTIIAELPKTVRTYKGDLDVANDQFVVPCDTLKDTCYRLDFKTGQVETIKLGLKDGIARLAFSIAADRLYVITETNILCCFDRNFKLLWRNDFNTLGKEAGRISPSRIFSSEDGQYLCVVGSTMETKPWGAEYVLDHTDGTVVRQIEGYQHRGRLAANFFGNDVLLYTLKTLDLTTGQVSEMPIFDKMA